MKGMRMTAAAALLLTMITAGMAYAGGKTEKPHEPTPQVEPVGGIEASFDLISDASATAAAQASADAMQAQFQDQFQQMRNANDIDVAGGEARASAVGDVDVGGDVTHYRSTAIALAVPGATAAPAVPGACIRHSRGWSVGFGAAARSGGTYYDQEQCERAHCLAIADRYAHAGLYQAMADQLASCGGIKGVVVPPATPPSQRSVTPEDLAALEQRLTERMDRQVTRSLAK